MSLKQLVKLQKVAGIQKCQEESHFYANKNVCATISNNRRFTVLWSCFFLGGGFVSPCSVSVTVEDEDVQKKLRPCQQIVW